MGTVTRCHDGGSVRIELEIWHPDCWTLEVTAGRDAGLVARGVYAVDGDVHARLTAHGPSVAAVDALVDAIANSPRTDTVRRLTPRLEPDERGPTGKATRELLVAYPDTNSIYRPFLTRGFVPDTEIRIVDGREYWTVVAEGARRDIQRRLDEVRSSMDADIEVLRIASAGSNGRPDGRPAGASLSDRQREAIQLACRRGYYEWPREASATELAAEFGVNKATFLEHLRKAESKLLAAGDVPTGR